MDESVLISPTCKNANDIGLASVQENIHASASGGNGEIHVAEKRVGRKNLKSVKENKKNNTANATERRLTNITEQKSENDGNERAADKGTDDSEQTNNLNKTIRKRKSVTKEAYENVTTQEIDDMETEMAVNAKNVETHENTNIENPKRKYTRKESPQSSTEQNTADKPNSVKESTSNSKETKNDRVRNSESKIAIHPPISEMVLASFGNLRKRNGVTAEEISKYVNENYSVNINRIKSHIKKFLQKGVSEGLFVQVNGKGDVASFKLKKAEKVEKETGKVRKTTDKVAKKPRKVKVITGREKRSIKKVTKVKNDKEARTKRRYATRKSTK